MFAYCNNNPVNAFDPTGEASIWYYLFEAGRFGFIHECVQNHILFKYRNRSITKEYSVYTGRADIVDTKTHEVWEIKHGKSAAYFDERMSNATYQATKYLQQKAIGKLGAAHAFQGDFIINCLQESYLVSYWTPQEGAILYSVELLPDYQSICDYKFEPIVKPNRNESILDKPNFSFRPNYSQDMLNGLVFLAAVAVVSYATGLWGLLFL